MTELKPCPWCGKSDKLKMHPRKTRHYDKPLQSVMCTRCGTRGRYQRTEERAVTEWNTRPLDAEAAEMAQRIQSLELECAKLAEELRDKAKLLRAHADGLAAPLVVPSTKELMALTMLDSASRMEEAADTIISLRNRLQELQGVGGESRYAHLFGTPERTAGTLIDICDNCGQNECSGCQVYELTSGGEVDYDALLEWLKGDA